VWIGEDLSERDFDGDAVGSRGVGYPGNWLFGYLEADHGSGRIGGDEAIETATEAGFGFGFLAVVIGYLPFIYGAFGNRETNISLLDARAGTPPTAGELLRRHSYPGGKDALRDLLKEWELWSAELLESHLSYPVLAYFRSQHDNQSWIGALTAILDACALAISGIEGACARQAELTFAIARHALVDLSQILSQPPVTDLPDRLPAERYEKLYELLSESGVKVCRDGQSIERLREMRALYEGYAEALSRLLYMSLPPWLADHASKDNWLTVAKVRARTDAANPPSSDRGTAAEETPSAISPFVDRPHDF